jgi:hypothetical protein
MAKITTKFKAAVNATPDVSECYQAGLKAFGKYSVKILLEDSSACEGSLDIDTCLQSKYPDDNRRDYCFSYDGEVFFVEVHPASSSDVSTMLDKLQWLKNWLKNNAPEINELKAKSKTPFYWISTGRYNILADSRQERRLAQLGLRPINRLKL